eukprot:gnl/MRDRNA2_/MRDRNA2_73136_c0_seq1.p1 gnl/MRDRNA2_/MRDRNA2_73136_c0~~gnl/MRDRNA2_/MRDRNA2_73136_c0_seq1.p1  ORF type:complete len:397 (+),score=20.15 gnl/MRDRNA2_/MRDRNA2_73136_c0_seq1:141-1331(+)
MAASFLRSLFDDWVNKIGYEIAFFGLLWIVGCPLLATYGPAPSDWHTDHMTSFQREQNKYLYPHNNDSTWGRPDLCQLPNWTVSAAMTGRYPKLMASICTTMFALLNMGNFQSCCQLLRLGWMNKISPSSNVGSTPITRDTALAFWNRICTIERTSYIGPLGLMFLCVFDSKYFDEIHITIALIAFFGLYRTLSLLKGVGDSFPEFFSNLNRANNSSVHLVPGFWLCGVTNLVIFLVLEFAIGFIDDGGYCEMLFGTQSGTLEVIDNLDNNHRAKTFPFQRPDYSYTALIFAMLFHSTEWIFGIAFICIPFLDDQAGELYEYLTDSDGESQNQIKYNLNSLHCLLSSAVFTGGVVVGLWKQDERKLGEAIYDQIVNDLQHRKSNNTGMERPLLAVG